MKKLMIQLCRFRLHSPPSRHQIFRYSTAGKSTKPSRPHPRAHFKNRPEAAAHFASLFTEISDILGADGFSPSPEASSVTEPANSETLALCRPHVREIVPEAEFVASNDVDLCSAVGEITEILLAGSGLISVEERLESSGHRFDTDIVEMVLKRCLEVPHLAMRFFNWVGLRDEFRPMTETYNVMLHIAGEAKEFGFLEKLVEEMEARSCQKDLETWTILISHYGRAKLIGKALSAFEKMMQSGYKADFAIYSEMIQALCVARKTHVALEFYKEMMLEEISPSLDLYKMLLNCVATSGDADAVHSIADDMVSVSQIPENIANGFALKSFCVSGRITEALEMIRCMKNRGLSFEPEHYGTLVEGLCRVGRVEDALEIADIMRRKNLGNGNIFGMIIDGYLRKKDASRALDLFWKMKEGGHVPSRSTYTDLIWTLLQFKEYEKGRELFDEMLERGLEPEPATFMAIIAAHASHGNVSEACRIFDMMKEKGIEPTRKFYLLFIDELCKKAKTNEIFKVLNEVDASKVDFRDQIFERVISYFQRKGKTNVLEKVRLLQKIGKLSVEEAEELYNLSQETPVTESNCTQPDLSSVGSELVDAPSPIFKGEIEEVSKILMSSSAWSLVQDGLENLSVKFTPEYVVKILRDCKIHGHTALNFFNWVAKQDGYNHTTETYNMAIKIAGCSKSFRHMRSLFYEMKRNQITITPHTWTIMIMLYGRIGLTEIALRLFHEMVSSGCKPAGSTYKYLIMSLCGRKGRKADMAVKLFHEMVNRDHRPDKELIETYLSCLCETGRLSDATKCVEYLGEVGFTTELRYSLYIRSLCRCQKLDEAQKLVNTSGADRLKLNTFVYGSIVHGLLRKGQLKEALDKVEEMKQVGINPTVHVYTSLIVHFFKEKQIKKVAEILEKMQVEGCEPTVVTYSALIRGYTNAGNFNGAKSIFNKMKEKGPQPDFRTYSMFIDCLCASGLSEEALKLITEMFDSGIAPSSINFRTVFFGLNREGKRELANAVLHQKKAVSRRRQFCNTGHAHTLFPLKS